MRKLIVSVPHCGTRFLMARLKTEDNVHTTWAWPKIIKLLEPLKGRPPIVAMRDPAAVWESWCRRRKAEGQHAAGFEAGDFFLAWGKLHALDLIMELDVICVDQKKDPRITDWSIVSSWPGEDASTLPVDLRSVYELPIVSRYYPMPDFSKLPFNRYNQEDRQTMKEAELG